MPATVPRRLWRAGMFASVTLGTLLPGAFASAGLAHEFNTVLIVPAGDEAQETRDAMQRAFLIASRERDGHPDETSEGHLGGLDVQLTLIGQDRPDLVAAADPDFVVAPLSARDEGTLAAIGAGLDAVIISRTEIEATPMPGMLEADADVGFDSFEARFRAETGNAPNDEAIAAYLAARWIERVVRPLGAVDDRDALRQALGR